MGDPPRTTAPTELTGASAALSGAPDRAAALARLCDLAVELVPGCASASTGEPGPGDLAVALAGTDEGLVLHPSPGSAFGAGARDRAELLGALGGLALAALDERRRAERQTADLMAALATRELIGQAQGILMERRRLTADEAFTVLRHCSQQLNRKLHDVARHLIETGELPVPGA